MNINMNMNLSSLIIILFNFTIVQGLLSYSIDGRGGAIAFDSTKHKICSLGRYLMVSYLEDKTSRVVVTVYDLRNKFIAANSPFPQGENVLCFASDEHTAYVLSNTGDFFFFGFILFHFVCFKYLNKNNFIFVFVSFVSVKKIGALFQFTEKDIATKLDILIRKGLYLLAISIAAEEKCGSNEIVRLYKLYAENLFENKV